MKPLTDADKTAGFYDIRLGNKTIRCNNITGRHETVEERDFEPVKFINRNKKWVRTE